MRSYLFSFAAGLLVGCIYSVIKVRSPAPPLIALIGLLGILLGEQSPSLIKHIFIKDGTKTGQTSDQAERHALSQPPKAQSAAQADTDLKGKS